MSRISASLLAADLVDVEAEISRVETADRLHVDVMDGRFVPNIAFGFPMVEAVADGADMPVDVHVMVTEPMRHVERLLSMDLASVTVHVEATTDLSKVARTLEAHGITAGVAINPETDVTAIEPIPAALSRATVMTIRPGFTGQPFRPEALETVEYLAAETGLTVEVDGGVDVDTARQSARAGADVLVSGSTVFGSSDRPATIADLRAAADQGAAERMTVDESGADGTVPSRRATDSVR